MSKTTRQQEERYDGCSKVAVPRSARKPWYDITALTAGWNIVLITAAIGGIIGMSFKLVDTIAIFAIGTIILMVCSNAQE